MTQLRSVTCHMGSQCCLLPDTSEHTQPSPQPDRLVLDLPTI